MTPDTRPSLIETMKADAQKQIVLLPYHLMRLKQSAGALGYVYPGDAAVVVAIQTALENQNGGIPGHVSDTRVRLLLDSFGSLTIHTARLPALQGVPFVAVTHLTLDSTEPLLQHKTVYRPWYDATTTWLAQHPDYFDLIFLNEKGELCEGSRSNIYVSTGREWLTPPLSSGLLCGVLRTHLLATGQAKEATLSPLDLTTGKTSIRLSNALRGWFDVSLDPLLLPGRLLP